MPLSAVRIFEAAARRRSFKAAAGELNLSPSAVSHAIRKMEETLGVVAVRARRARHHADPGRGGPVRPCRTGLRGAEPRPRPRGEPRAATAAPALRPELRRAVARRRGWRASSASIRASRFGWPPAWTTPASSPTSSTPTSSTGRPAGEGLVRMPLGPGDGDAALRSRAGRPDPRPRRPARADADPERQQAGALDPLVRAQPAGRRRRPRRSASTGASWPWRPPRTGSASPWNRPASPSGRSRPAASSRRSPGARRTSRYVGHHFVCPADARRRAPLRVFARWLAEELAIDLSPDLA